MKSKKLIKSLRTDTTDTNTFDYLWLPGYETWTNCDWLSEKMPRMKQFIKLLVQFYRHFATMELESSQVALFCAYLLYDTGKTLNNIAFDLDIRTVLARLNTKE